MSRRDSFGGEKRKEADREKREYSHELLSEETPAPNQQYRRSGVLFNPEDVQKRITSVIDIKHSCINSMVNMKVYT